jgi:hypothetical protein
MNLEGITYKRVYYVVGVRQTHAGSLLSYEAYKNAPNAGYSRAIVIEPPEPKKAGKSTGKLTIFCPFTLTANQVSPEAGELHGAETLVLDEARVARLSTIIVDRWKEFCGLGLPKDYDVAAMVLQRMGVPVPTERPETTSSGAMTEHGKEAGGTLLRPVNRESKRGKIAEFFLASEGRSILEAMAQFGSSRPVILTHLYGLHIDHGLGYKISGDAVTMGLPDGCEDAFAQTAAVAEKPSAKKAAKEKIKDKTAAVQKAIKPKKDAGKEAIRRASGKPLASKVTPLPEKGKRRDVAICCAEGFVPIEEVAARAQCSAASVRSHLTDLHTKHGFGFEQEGNKVRLLVPEGWTP